ncbi:hypothetical protein [Candidatus Poriferisodalis sp.]|uniref:hypothetical protein n=1 Tax=Candidatus Poriferisodalis sp. TaxID=3101277 RepID=UPI003B516BC9
MPVGDLDHQITSTFTGGVTGVAIDVRFNGFVNVIHDDQLFADMFDATIKRNTPAGETTPTRNEFLGTDALDTPNVRHLPMARDLVTTAGGKDAVVDDPDTADDETAVEVVDVATGFNDDPDSEDENEKLNADSQHRIRTSSGVKGPTTPTYPSS